MAIDDKTCAAACIASYKPVVDVDGLEILGAVESGRDAKAVLYGASDGNALLCFQGTFKKGGRFPFFDWWTNADHHLVEWKGGKAHKGHLKNWWSLRHDVCDMITDSCPRSVKVTGHSKGGSEALLAAISISYSVDVSLVTFAASKSVDKTLADLARHRVKSSVRYQMAGDLVPFLPSAHHGYVHPWKAKWLWGFGNPHSMKLYERKV